MKLILLIDLALMRIVAEPKILAHTFYERDTRIVAVELIGKFLFFRQNGGKTLSGKIVETEAYLGQSDPASHAYRGPTPRNRVMFGRAGFSYVYFTYGFHHCFNVVTEHERTAGAVLVRAVEPLGGIDCMKERRRRKHLYDLTNGPGKLTQAFGLTREHSGLDLTKRELHIEDDNQDDLIRIGISPRIGIKENTKALYRYFLMGNRFVSR